MRDEQRILKYYRLWYEGRRLRFVVFAIVLVFYILFFLALAPQLGIAVNYLVLLPVISCSLSFGFVGGVVAGTLGLPANLTMLSILGLVRYMPENHIVAEAAGILLGVTLGSLGGHFRSLGMEILRRREVEERLRGLLKERSLLLREIHHRVKNNLNVIHGLIGLQSGHLTDPECAAKLTSLSSRIYSMSMVHDQLNDLPYGGTLRLSRYIPPLFGHIVHANGHDGVESICRVNDGLPEISLSRATTLGLIVNEVVSNAMMHAFEGLHRGSVELSLGVDTGRYILTVRDDGVGYGGEESRMQLGGSLIRVLSKQLGGRFSYDTGEGTVFTLNFPVESETDILRETEL